LLLVSESSCYALEVTLEWDPSSEPELAYYRVYRGTSSGVYPKLEMIPSADILWNSPEGPNHPVFEGKVTITNSLQPAWAWSSGGGGKGLFRYKLNDSDLESGAAETASTSYKPDSQLPGGVHILYVQEKDEFGTWSESALFPIIIDATLDEGLSHFISVRAFSAEGLGSPYSREVCVIAPSSINPPYNRGWQITSGDLEGFKVFYNSTADPGIIPTLGSSDDIPRFDLAGLTGLGIPVNLQPSGAVFNEPLWSEFPCPGYSNINQLSLGLYDGNQWNLVWDGAAGQLTTVGEGWLDGDPEYNTGETPHTITLVVKHFTGVQAAVTSSGTTVTVETGGGGGGCFIDSLMR